MIIDWQHHFLPEEIYRSGRAYPGESSCRDGQSSVTHQGKVTLRIPEELYQVDSHLKFMDTAGIDIAVLSYTAASNIEDCKRIHDSYGDLMKKYPGRFVGLALCIPTMGDEAIDEFNRAISEIGLRGVVISSQFDGIPLDSEKLTTFYTEVSKKKVPVFVHPTPLTTLINGYPAFEANYDLYNSIAREFDLANAVARVILGGVLTKFPELKLVMSHMGGGISIVMERLLMQVARRGSGFWTDMGGTPPFKEPFVDSIINLFNQIYFDLAGYQGAMNVVKCNLTMMKPERLLFATDYPFNFRDAKLAKNYVQNLKNLGLPPNQLDLVLGGNAMALLKLT